MIAVATKVTEMLDEENISLKAPQDVLFDVPQERLTGDVLRGYGPRRGNLERLLRYWRPIMRKPGGFRRCRVILANHPELYPLERICAWLHHETTGLWPNEGCHHPGMKNCRKKIRGVRQGSLWTDKEFNERMRKLKKRSSDKKSLNRKENYVVTSGDVEYAMKVLSEFCEMEKSFTDWLRNESNWEYVGENSEGKIMSYVPVLGVEKGEDCGC
jgi:hypothetical protein